jgi:hypothetical protein
MVIWDRYWCIALESALTETWLRKGDLPQAHSHAEAFVNVTHASSDRAWHASAWEAKTRVAIAEGNLPRARDCIAKAVATVENFDVPLAAWRVHATAAEVYRSTGNISLAQRAQELSQSYKISQFPGRATSRVIPARVVRQQSHCP